MLKCLGTKRLVAIAPFVCIVLCTGLMATACDDDDAKTLNSGHTGWQVADCWSCHSQSNTHNSNKAPYECTACHGTNGAPNGHNGSTPCSTCHGVPHGETGFPDPDSCETCH